MKAAQKRTGDHWGSAPCLGWQERQSTWVDYGTQCTGSREQVKN